MKLNAVPQSAASAITALLIVLLAGCFSSDSPEEPSEPFSAEEAAAPLVEEWKNLPAEATLPQRMEIASRLILLGPDSFNPMFDIIADPATEPMDKLYVLQSIMSFIQPVHFERLQSMAGSEDATTRTMAVQLIGYTEHPEAIEFLTGLADDPEDRVRFAALASRVLVADPAAHEPLMKLYFSDETPELQKEEIVRVILTRWSPKEIDVLTDAVAQPWLSTDIRNYVASTLGQMGIQAAIEPLQKSLEVDDDAEYKELTETIIAALAEIEEDSTE